MSDIQIFIKDSDDEGTWEYIDEGLLDLSEHDEKVRADAIDEFAKLIHEDLYQLNHHQVDFLAEQLKEKNVEH